MDPHAFPPEVYAAVLAAAPDPILLVDPAGIVVLANKAVHRVLGYRIDELVGESIDVLLPGSMRAGHAAHRARYEQEPSARQMGSGLDLVALRKDGSVVPVDVSLSPVTLRGGRFVICIARDISEQRAIQAQLRELSYRDVVTGLYSRFFLETEIERLDRSQQFPLTCFVFDVDAMKEVNDTLGHPAGDDLLRRCANVLRRCFRSEDIIARTGGDEFAVLVPGMGEKEAREAGVRIRQILEEHDVSSLGEAIRMSWGCATAQGPPLRDVVALADRRMYEAKQQRSARLRTRTSRRSAR